MSTQWHPLFAHLLGLLLQDLYDIQVVVPVSDLPRKGDLLVVRRQAGPQPPFQGLWSHLTDVNILEFKGPTDAPEESDLDLLVHVGTGIAYRLNEERRARGEARLENRRVSFWYLAPALGETFLKQALDRVALTYETGGLWRGRVFGHPFWLVSYRDVPVEEDTIPLHLLDREPDVPLALGKLIVSRQELLQRFAMWLHALQPGLWEEIRAMASTATGIIDWEALGKTTDLYEVIRILPPEGVIQVLGVQRAVEAIGLPKVIEAVGLPKVIEAVGPEKLLAELSARVPREQLQEMLQRLPRKE
jgi:hypothetical protein